MRILDLFCGAGGAAMGLHRAFPDAEIVGIDIKAQPRYPFKFVQGDVLEHFDPSTCAHLCSFDFIWASPPCQRYSVVTPKAHRAKFPDLIAIVREHLIRAEVPYAIENVPGARSLMRAAFMLCGSMFGLRTRRHRLFETSFLCAAPASCDHSEPPLLVTTAGANSRRIGNFKSTSHAMEAYGINWMTGDGLKEAIPPAYSQYIGEAFMFMREHGKRQSLSPKIGTEHEIELKRDFPCQHCGRTIYVGLSDGKTHNRDGTYHDCGLADLQLRFDPARPGQ